MCNWRKWIWPGILATVLLTALAMLMKSGSIEQDLQAKALGDLSGNHSWAQVELDGRDLTLTGIAPSEDAAAEALQIADDAYDVRVAASNVELLPIADPFKLSAVKSADNKIMLSGSVPSDEARASIVEAAKAANGDAEVVDEMTLARGAPEGFGALAAFGISQLTDFTDGSASLDGSALSVNGNAPSVEIYDAANAALNGTLPGGGTLAAAEISAPTADPYTLTATKSADGVVLDGYVPSNAVRADMVAEAEAASGGSVTDNLQLALGAPEGFAALSGFGISQLDNLSSGEASLSNLDLSVRGSAPSVDVYNETNAALNGALPGGGSLVSADISAPTADPFTFAATKSATGIVLDGFVPSNAVRADMVAEAEAASGGGSVTDNLQLALGAPEGFGALAGFGVSQLDKLSSGEASLSNLDLSVRGSAPTVEIFNETNAALNGELPSGGVLATADVSSPVADPFTFSARKTAAGITLDGFVPSEQVRAQLISEAEKAHPGKPITDNLRLALGNQDGFVPLASFGIGELTDLASGEMSLSNENLTFKGVASTVPDYNKANAALKGDLPGGGVLAMADIVAPTANPYTLKATKSAGGIVLEGSVPSEAARNSVVSAVKSANPGKDVTDNLRLALGNPDGFVGLAEFGANQIGDLQTGEMSLKGLDLSIKGEASTFDSYDAVTGRLANNMPAGSNLAMQDIIKPAVSPYVFSAIEREDGVTLNGFVPDDATRGRLVAAARATTDGPVTDNLQIGRGAPAGFADVADFGVARLGDFSTGSVEMSDLDLTVRGTAISPDSYNAAIAAVGGAIPAGGKVVNSDITRSTVSPYSFKAVKSDDSVVLSGFVGSESAKDAAVSYATATNPGLRIVDQLLIANGAPDGVDWPVANELAIKELSQLSNGSASLLNEKYTIEGVAKSVGDFDQVKAEANGSLPAGLSLASEDVRLPSVSPYTWSLVNMEGSNPVLTGFVPDMDMRAESEKLANDSLSGGPVDNKLSRAAGAPTNLDAAISVATQAVSELKNARADIRDNDLMVSGEAADEAAAVAIRAKVENGVPPGFTGKHAITFPEPVVEPKPAPKPAPKPVDCQPLMTKALEGNTIQFETAKAVIKEDSFNLLNRLSTIIKRCPTAMVEIGGHTDSDGSEKYNQSLSKKRADAVRSYLIANGVFVGRLSAVGYGETQPVGDNATEEGKALNRRIEFNVVK